MLIFKFCLYSKREKLLAAGERTIAILAGIGATASLATGIGELAAGGLCRATILGVLSSASEIAKAGEKVINYFTTRKPQMEGA